MIFVGERPLCFRILGFLPISPNTWMYSWMEWSIKWWIVDAAGAWVWL